ncbi:hypothetical protein CP967_02900 [Streptomyces nitrosporeus]|uniref:Uncharacterized protein n=1 Tax=Streptomyces nitrosporeus TaxID=28894 RepID=A0A5J6F3Z5_9ACTN|nr:hypothetical protein [Streptomyces nitrosporeus]QEU71049.1 hypothetical protein CP967_02900 [Streptomyces nitrosporeus]GGZ14696.1 hypothetical protein GCM10010327_51980 [Streptomyces nitrosporeus]
MAVNPRRTPQRSGRALAAGVTAFLAIGSLQAFGPASGAASGERPRLPDSRAAYQETADRPTGGGPSAS